LRRELRLGALIRFGRVASLDDLHKRRGVGAGLKALLDFLSGATGQGAVLLETRDWDDLPERVMVASYSASRSLRTAAI